MCGIAGSSNPDQAFKLYLSNLNRGYYSCGYYDIPSRISSRPRITLKRPGSFAVRPGYETLVDYHLYHSRGPTVETKDFIPDNNHPFFYGDWVVAHNGIISNYQELGKKYFPQVDFTGKTDSCIIPMMLALKMTPAMALEELQGTFALWMHNTATNKLYITRSSSTLFGNAETGGFCSTYFDGSQSLEEGYMYEVTQFNSLTKINSYKTDSPYFIL
jgi:glucosamine 6-phosphate synthetase-like amidotransferase/phosphosugar isomerase protein